MNKLRRHISLLKLLEKNKNKKLCSAIIDAADNDSITCICEIIKNVIHGNVRLSEQNKKMLSKEKKSLRKLASRGQLSLKKKRKMLKGGNILSMLTKFIIPNVLPALGKLFLP